MARWKVIDDPEHGIAKALVKAARLEAEGIEPRAKTTPAAASIAQDFRARGTRFCRILARHLAQRRAPQRPVNFGHDATEFPAISALFITTHRGKANADAASTVERFFYSFTRQSAMRSVTYCNVAGNLEVEMSAFSDSWARCMQGSGFPVPSVENAHEALEILHKLHDAWENSGGETDMTIGALLALGAVTGVDEGVLATLGEIATVAVSVYIGACIACIGSVALDDLRGLFASNEVPDFVVAQLNSQGVDLGGAVNA